MTWQPPVQNPGYGGGQPHGYGGPPGPAPLPTAYVPHGRLPLVLAGSALVMASAALVVAVLALGGSGDPLGKGLDHYDYSSPEKALVSDLEMRRDLDIRAQLDLERLRQNEHVDEKIASMEIDRRATYDDKQILFVSWTEDDKKQYKAEAFEKHEKSGLWLRTYVSTYDITDEILKDDITAWESKNQGEHPAPW
jgi:hypothetical protein